MLLQGDALAVQLFIGAAAISVLGIAITQAGWTHRWFVRWMFVLAALLIIASVGWRYFEIRIPIIDDALQAVASSRIAWFFMGIVPALAAGMFLSDSLRRRREATMRPSEWLSVSTAMDTLARQDLLDRYQYVSEQFHDAANKYQTLEQQISGLTSQMPLMADDTTRTEIRYRRRSLARMAGQAVIVMFGHVGRGIVDETDQCLRCHPASRIIICRRRCRDQHFDLCALLQLEGFLRLEDAVLVDSLDCGRHCASQYRAPAGSAATNG